MYTRMLQTLTPTGTPYWMAPEIIQMSDIWSVGCTVIELLQGQPPFFDLAPMRALYRIVQDPHPPLPPGISFACSDFLMLCFQKQPTIRSSAEDLLRHAWVTQKKKKRIHEQQEEKYYVRRYQDEEKERTVENLDVDITESHAKEYLSRTTKVPDHIRKALTGTIRIYNKDIIASHNEDEKKDDVKLVVDDEENITKEEDKGFDDNDDQMMMMMIGVMILMFKSRRRKRRRTERFRHSLFQTRKNQDNLQL